MEALADYDYELPTEQIAQSPMNPREDANLLILPRNSGAISHCHVHDFPSYLRSTDVLVLNNTKVFKARLIGLLHRPSKPEKSVELFLVRPRDHNWIALAKPGKIIGIGSKITIEHNFTCKVVAKHDDGSIEVTFDLSPAEVTKLAEQYGTVPVPPYIKKIPDSKDYQTAYARVTGSVAAPTAGFHLTTQLLQTIKKMGVTVVEITLHVGLGTFQPIRTELIEGHQMHSEWVEITPTAAETINEAKLAGRRIIAVGTTTTRALEGVADISSRQQVVSSKGSLFSYIGDVNLFIKPGFKFKVIDGLLTNFHLPKSTLLVLVSALAGREQILEAYNEAVKKGYRFYSFGDAMLIV